MSNNRKPKLAPGSRWEGANIRTAEDILIEPMPDNIGTPAILFHEHEAHVMGKWVPVSRDDALAAIRAAKLDPVFDSAVALAEYWDGLSQLYRDTVLLPMGLRELLDANSAAVRGATE